MAWSGNRKHAQGFTLIELMIVIVIVAILVAIAYPGYQEQVRKGRRARAQSDLVELTQVLERCYTVNNSYLTCAGVPNPLVAPLNVSPRSGTAFYGVSYTAHTRNAFTLQAAPTGDQANDRCGTMTINQQGVRTAAAGETDCWR